VITGASSGFGKGASLRFARQGASVVLAARRGELLEEVARECDPDRNRTLAVPTDVGKQDEVAKLARDAIDKFGKIDVWVNNAGAGAVGRFTDVPLQEHVKVIETDLLGTLYGSYFAMEHFRRRGEGCLINISSVIGKVPSPYFTSYAAAKHGVIGLSTSIRQELTEDKLDDRIHVCVVMPTTFDTPFFEHASGHTDHEVSPIPPIYDPEEVIETIVRLAAEPENEVSVGTMAKIANFSHHFAPRVIEAQMRKETRKAEFDDAKRAPQTEGSLMEPQPTGTSVRGGWKK